MQLVEQHIIERSDPRYSVIDAAAFASKNLYNAALYELRQAYIFQGIYLSYSEMDKRMQSREAYKALPAKVSQQVLIQLDKAWKSFFEARKAYKEDPSKFTGHPCLPKYKHKMEGRNILVYTEQAISKKGLKRGLVQPSQLPISVKTKQVSLNQVRLVPRIGFYVVEVVYEEMVKPAAVNPDLYAGIDLGTINLAVIASNKPGFQPVLVDGRLVRSRNQWYNKRKAKLQKKRGTTSGTTRQIERLTTKRNRQVNHALHTASRKIIDLLVKEGIGTLVIGKNPGWKQESRMSRRNNQNFVQIPHARLIDMLSYKAELVGIQVVVTEESYTSKASFLDLDEIPAFDPKQPCKEYVFRGKRVKRGMYRASGKRYINADLNGAYNIIRKHRPDAFAKGVAGYVVHPSRIDRVNKRKRERPRRSGFRNYTHRVGM